MNRIQRQALAIRDLIQAEILAASSDSETPNVSADKKAELADFAWVQMCQAFGCKPPKEGFMEPPVSGTAQ